MHWPDPLTPIDETLSALTDLVREGKVRYLGHSNFSGWLTAEAEWTSRTRGYERFISAQNEYSWLKRDIETDLVPALEHYRVGLLPFFPLASGLLTGKYHRGEAPAAGTRLAAWGSARLTDAQLRRDRGARARSPRPRGITLLDVAIGGLAAKPAVASVIAGATSAEQVAANVQGRRMATHRGRPDRTRPDHRWMTLRIFTEPQQGSSYQQLLEVARTAEECGYGAFMRSDHYLRMGSASGRPSTTDAWITLAGLARDTSVIRLGTLVTPVTFRPIGTLPVIAAQVDQMSAGRLELGLGAGWYADEHTAFGLPFPGIQDRYDLLEDQLAVLAGVWSAAPGAEFEFAGRTAAVHIDADTVRPAQQPGPPIILGGQAKARSARLAATYAAEYNSGFRPIDLLRTVHGNVRAACEQAGRDPSTMVYSSSRVLCCGETDAEIARRAAAIGRDLDDLRENGLTGRPAELIDKIHQLAAAGVERFYLQVLDLTDLDHLRLVAEAVMPHVPGR